jgi:hypothetical protein
VRSESVQRVNYDSSINGRLMVFGQGPTQFTETYSLDLGNGVAPPALCMLQSAHPPSAWVAFDLSNFFASVASVATAD